MTHFLGKWDHERATLKRSCEDVVDGMDADDLVVALWKGETPDGKVMVTECKSLKSLKGTQ
jgi:hypothetical protein